MKPLGGFFELEIGTAGRVYHEGALRLTSGRACLTLIAGELRPSRVHVPYYICDSALEPFRQAGIPYAFYALDDRFEPAPVPVVEPEEALLVVNYFGLKGALIEQLRVRFGNRLIVDNTQAFFERACPGAWAFNSVRKFFGVPDGAYLYAPVPMEVPLPPNDDIGYVHLVERLLGHQGQAYQAYVENEARITAEPRGMSRLTERLLGNVDYPAVAARRRENFAYLADALGGRNALVSTLSADAVPFCYPLLLKRGVVRSKLYDRHLFVPTLWRECLERREAGFAFERELAQHLLPLPIDHRYDQADLARAVAILEEVADV